MFLETNDNAAVQGGSGQGRGGVLIRVHVLMKI